MMRVAAAAAAIIFAACVVCNGLDNNNAWNEIARDDFSGSAGEGISWHLDEATGVLTISGSGEMSNFSNNQAPWYQNRTLITSVVIADGITSIGNYAFQSCSNMTSLSIPSSVTYIGSSGVSGCKKLTSLTIPSSVTYIGNSAFSSCVFPSLTLPSGVEIIKDWAFSGCTFTSISIPSTVTSIGSLVFYQCYNLTSITVDKNNKKYKSEGGVLFNYEGTTLMLYPSKLTGGYTIPDGVVTISERAFNECGELTSVFIPSSVTSIGQCAFLRNYKLASVNMPLSVKTIADSAFSYCSSLKSVILPSVTSIGKQAFSECVNLTTVTLGENVTKIGESPFQDCSQLQAINVDEKNTRFKSIDGVLFDMKGSDGVTLLQYPPGRVGNYTVPNNVTTIAKYAFYGCMGLQTVNISSDVREIGEYAFQCCYNLTTVNIEPGLEYIMSYAFMQCINLPGITLPGTVHSIGNYAFYNCKKIYYVIYLGTTPPSWCSAGVFYYVLDKVCVPLDFTGASFCHQTVHNHESSLEYLRVHNNHCYEVLVCDENHTSIYKRANATEWESQSHGCYEYVCDNATGGVVITCNNSKSLKCVNDQCVPKTEQDESSSSSSEGSNDEGSSSIKGSNDEGSSSSEGSNDEGSSSKKGSNDEGSSSIKGSSGSKSKSSVSEGPLWPSSSSRTVMMTLVTITTILVQFISA